MSDARSFSRLLWRCTAGFRQTAGSLRSLRTSRGANEVYVENFLYPTKRRRVSTSGGSYPRWSRTGNELFFLSVDGQLVTVPAGFNGTSADVGKPRVVMPLIEPPAVMLYPYDIASDGRILALAPVAGEATDISLTVLVDWQAALRR